MRGAAGSMTVLRPRDAREALRLFARRPDALPLSGGTDLMVAWNLGSLNDRLILDLSLVREWSRITRSAGSLRLGALVTHAAAERHPLVRHHFGLLVQAAATVGGLQIQERGTIAGNVANASPAADTVPPLAVYDARVHVASATGHRVVPILEIFAGPKQTTLGPGELIEAIDLPFLAKAPSRQMFRKVGTRAAQAVSKIVAAGLVWTAKDGTVTNVRVALGSMAPTPRRLREAESYLVGRRLAADTARQAAALLAEDVAPIDDVRSTASYRLATAQRLLEGFLAPAV
jgi:xanthine dehydrogenase small subunit